MVFKFAMLVGLFCTPVGLLGGEIALSLANGNDGGQPFNTTAFGIANQSGGGVTLSAFELTVGDTLFNYDEIYLDEEKFAGGEGTQVASLIIGDRNQDDGGPDEFRYEYSNFVPGVSFAGQWDIDFDTGEFDVDARKILFNNGDAPNAVLTLEFSDGSTTNYTFPDLPIQDTYTLVIPEPAGVLLAGLLGVFAIGARRSA